MLLEENQIAFHSDDGLIVDGVKDYSHQIAEMIGLTSDSEFRLAGVSTLFVSIFFAFLSAFTGPKSGRLTFSYQDKLIFNHCIRLIGAHSFGYWLWVWQLWRPLAFPKCNDSLYGSI